MGLKKQLAKGTVMPSVNVHPKINCPEKKAAKRMNAVAIVGAVDCGTGVGGFKFGEV